MSAKKKADMKVIIMGDYAVGKTSLICRYIEGKFKQQEATVGAAFFLKQWGPYNIAVWDTAGDEKYMGLSHFYCRGARAAILAYDISDSRSFESLWAKFTPLLEAASEDCIRVVVGTKLDLITPENRQVTVDEGCRLAREMNDHLDPSRLPRDPYFETSSLNGRNVAELFEFIFQLCLPLSDKEKDALEATRRNTVDLHDSLNTKSGDKGCGC